MRRYIYLLLPLMLSGCFDDDSKQAKSCFQIIDSERMAAPIMVDSCKGESWMLIRNVVQYRTENLPEVYSYSWYKMDRYDDIRPEMVSSAE
ncbi:MAG: hypothetical protein R3D71_09615 [Rickettsiales bacterium]